MKDLKKTDKGPFHPYQVLGVAVLLPGMGQVLNGQAERGLMMAFSALLLGWVSYHLTTPEHSFIGRYAGGFFVHALAILDAYRYGRIRWARWQLERPAGDQSSQADKP